MLVVSSVDSSVAVFNDNHGSVVIVNVAGLEECIDPCPETGLSEDACRRMIFAHDSLSFNCQDTESPVAIAGHAMFAKYFPNGLV